MSRIWNLNELEIGKSYKIVGNAGYYSKLCVFTGYKGQHACLLTDAGHQELVSMFDIYHYDNPIMIYRL
jgi:hypothetical protein